MASSASFVGKRRAFPLVLRLSLSLSLCITDNCSSEFGKEGGEELEAVTKAGL